MRIWGRANSSNVKKVLWCAEELGLPYERIDAGGAFGRLADPEFRALNPNGMVPVIEDDGVVAWESNAIVRYLAARHGAGTLWPEDPAVRVLGDRWMDWVHLMAAPYATVVGNVVRKAPADRDHAAVAAGIERLSELFARVDAHLAREPYLGGAAFTMADIPLGAYIYAWFEMPIERPAMPHLEDWYHRLGTREPYRRAVMTPLT